MEPDVNAAGITLTNPLAYTNEDQIQAALRVLRRRAPVHWVETADYEPFWAITRHADVLEVERNSHIFLNAPRIRLAPKVQEVGRREQEIGLRTLIHMDDPEHRKKRAVTAAWFRPAAIRLLSARLADHAKAYLNRMAELDGECDFVRDITTPYALDVIMSLLGLPESDLPYLRRLAEELFGGDDSELQRGTSPEARFACLQEFRAYFTELAVRRRKQPTDDLASLIANARVDGELLSEMDVVSYYILIVTAGHDQNAATIAGGLHALVELPQEFDRLRRNHALLPSAVDEMIRWVTPTKTFMRTAARDYELHGRTIKEGDALLLCFHSANRDEEVFDDPFRFDIGRNPNRHLAFGHGQHSCIGAALALLEIQAFWAELLPRLKFVELTGTRQLTATTFVGGLKRLPIRYKLRP
ncbi:MAG TPA: cytochrome P450 [Pseudonocardiaceae bacterium]|jgi:cytochrome P450|nr:cytochrome P450 [Pseudonocardiaceae bacterium]